MDQDSQKPIVRVLGKEAVWPPPIWLMRQAGRYLPEYRALRAKAGSFLDLCFNSELATEVTLQPIRRFGFDAAILFADILLVPYGLGQKLWFEEGEGPRLEPIADTVSLKRLRPEKVLERVAPVFETVRRARAALPKEVALIGFAGAPWTVATYMIAGRGTPDQAPARDMARRDPAFFADLNDLLVEATVRYLDAQIEAGAEVIQLFDTWAGAVEPDLFEALIIEPTKKIVALLHARRPSIPIIGFPRNIGVFARGYMENTGVTAISLSSADALGALTRFPLHAVLQGGLDPQTLVLGGRELETGVRQLLSAARGRPYIFNLGHGIVPQTPIENVTRLVELVRGARA
ncbi:MAG TPA: uroporphyrinogen decarboxylase [Alphaproteobacteria bacterium]|nr:uroporphyrinogen decarboxylase [Alphaproteobacteria bacterium]